MLIRLVGSPAWCCTRDLLCQANIFSVFEPDMGEERSREILPFLLLLLLFMGMEVLVGATTIVCCAMGVAFFHSLPLLLPISLKIGLNIGK